MNNLLKLILLSIILCFSQCTANTEYSPEQKKEALLEALDKFNTAFQNGDVQVLESMITDQYLHTNSSSKAIRKDDWLNYLKKRHEDIVSGKLVVLENIMDEVNIEFYENTAIVTARISVSSKSNDEIRKQSYRITNVWVYENGKWKRAGFHDGRIPQSDLE